MNIYLNVCKQMTDITLLLLRSSPRNHLAVCKKIIKSRLSGSYYIEILEIIQLKKK